MKVIRQDEKYYTLQVEPRLKEDMEAFKKAVVVLDTQYLLPVRIALISPDNKSSKDFQVEHIVPNAKVIDTWFQGRPLKEWKLIRTQCSRGRCQGTSEPRRVSRRRAWRRVDERVG